jgi:hypothetical protein
VVYGVVGVWYVWYGVEYKVGEDKYSMVRDNVRYGMVGEDIKMWYNMVTL